MGLNYLGRMGMLILMVVSCIIVLSVVFTLSLCLFAGYLDNLDCFRYLSPLALIISFATHFSLLGIIGAIGHFYFLIN